MTTNRLIQIFSRPQEANGIPEASLISEIMKHVEIDVGMDSDGETYCYCINVLDLSKSDISDDTIYEMVNTGWTISDNRKKVLFFC